ncbi:hypothetical protein HQ590_13090 [bacterium]|nr:hypothetical protein [bacterium]
MSQTTIEITDFPRSYLRWRMDTTKKPPLTVSRPPPITLNNVRMPLECRTVLTPPAGGAPLEFVLGASCKSEQVWVKSDIWHQPNADMCMWGSATEFVVYKRWDKTDKGVLRHPPTLGVQPEKQREWAADVFDQYGIERRTCHGRVLADTEDILAALGSDRPVVAQTEYRAGGYGVLLEYPVKTVNYSERERFYQVDTGPVLLPDLTDPGASLLESCRLAYVAHNCPDWAEFIVCVPTPVTKGARVHHYSQVERIERTANRMVVVE